MMCIISGMRVRDVLVGANIVSLQNRGNWNVFFPVPIKNLWLFMMMMCNNEGLRTYLFGRLLKESNTDFC